ncbi:MAG: Ldh family oxidoreductase [Chloroflexi bacterium]|nr:Ldh family oxidoreductase [Chloroflexota bacterium]
MLTISADRLTKVATDIFRAAGASPENTECVVSALIGANLAGHDSHGILRIPAYVADIKAGRLDPKASPEVVHEVGSTAIVDGGATFGQVGARFAADTAVAKAKTTGIAAVTARNCHHTGRIGEWAERVAAAGLVGFATTAGIRGPYSTVPFGGAKGALGTNPLAWAFPRTNGRPPILLDYATSAVAQGKLQVARAKGAPVPEGCIIDKNGNPTTNVEDYFAGGNLLPFAGHKGYSLSVVVELLAVGLSGGAMVAEGTRGSCFFVLAMSPTAFVSQADFDAYVDSISERMTATPPAPGFSRVLLPGEPEASTRAERLQEGIPVAERTWEQLEETAGGLGVSIG